LVGRLLVWGVAIGFAGAVFADYSSYDESLRTTAMGGVFGFVFGIVIGLCFAWYDGKKKA
jgi:hypothetical protein